MHIIMAKHRNKPQPTPPPSKYRNEEIRGRTTPKPYIKPSTKPPNKN